MQDALAKFAYREELAIAQRAAREAAQYLSSLSEGQRSVQADLPHDVKLIGDVTSESIILTNIQNESPHPVITEETGVHGHLSNEAPYWVVDPIDGSFNFYRGVPLVAISIGLWKGNEPLLGLICDFQKDELFLGAVGYGAWLNNRPISVSNVDQREESILATGVPVAAAGDPDYATRLSEKILTFRKIRMFGSAAISLAYLACGRIDAYSEDEILLWDVAAGIALVRAAGGNVWFEETTRDYGLRVRAAANARIWE